MATHIRGTMLASSLAVVREEGFEQKYFALLPAQYHTAVHGLVAQDWLSMELAIAHYAAMDRMFPTMAQQLENGRRAAQRAQVGYIQAVVRTLRLTGTIDLAAGLKRVPDVIARIVRGGSCNVYLVARKDGRIELNGYPFLASRYVHNGWQGMFEASFSMLSRRIFVRQDLLCSGDDCMALDVSWV